MKTFVRSVLKIIIPKSKHKKARQTFEFIKSQTIVFLRKNRLLPFSKYNKLKKYHNIHKGKRCFIVATGPSLTIDDINKLKDEFTFSMNSIVLCFKETSWHPTYYAIQDKKVYQSLSQDKSFDLSGVKSIFIGRSLEKHIKAAGSCVPQDYNVFDLFGYRQSPEEVDDARKYVPTSYKLGFSDDIRVTVYGYNIAYSVLQIAVYMGFSEIYLLGCDCNYNMDKDFHFIEYVTEAGKRKKDPLRLLAVAENIILSYKSAKEYADLHGIKIYNATRGGKLEVFERVDLDEVLMSDA